ncbi:MAG: hypothetical protein WBA13_05590 [Microcoleaceae cyanobacterium]
MDSSDNLTSTCRCCQYYTPEGRRGGQCQQLHVPVKGGWKACQLAIPAFAMSWEIKEIMEIQHQHHVLKETLNVEHSLNSSPTHATLEATLNESAEVTV